MAANKTSLALGLAAALLAGCSSAGEEAARAAWTDVRDTQQYADVPETPPPDDLATHATLEDLVAIAMQRNAGLHATFDRWTAQLESVSHEKALPDPRFSYGYYIEPIQTRVGPMRQRFRLDQTIPLGGEPGLRGEMAAHAANAVAANFDSQRHDLRFRVTRLWHEYYYLKRAIEITETNVALLQKLETVALSQYSAGRVPHSAVVRAQVELGRLEDQLLTLRDQRAPLLSELNATLNRPLTAAIAWPHDVDARPITQDSETLRTMLLTHNPSLRALQARGDEEAAGAKLAGRAALPDLTLGAEYIQIDKLERIDDSGQDAILATAAINVPLWFGQYGARKDQANARRSAILHEQTQLKNELLALLERAHFEFRDADRRVELYLYSLLPRARQAFEVTEDAFVSGGVDFLELVDAQRTLLEFELAYERAVTERATKRAHVEHILGVGLDAGEGENNE